MKPITTITVINDGQVRYPVYTADMDKWVAENGKITGSNYEQFCDAVDMCCCPGLMTGSAEMIDLCSALVAAGADVVNLPAL